MTFTVMLMKSVLLLIYFSILKVLPLSEDGEIPHLEKYVATKHPVSALSGGSQPRMISAFTV